MGLEGLAAIPLGLLFLVSGLLTNLLEVRRSIPIAARAAIGTFSSSVHNSAIAYVRRGLHGPRQWAVHLQPSEKKKRKKRKAEAAAGGAWVSAIHSA